MRRALAVSGPWIACALVLAATLAAQMLWMFALDWRVDEAVHGPAVIALAHGVQHEAVQSLTMVPAYHHVLAARARISGTDSAGGIRVLAALLALAILPAASWLTARWDMSLRHSDLAIRGMQVVALPLVFPFVFLVYTDVPSAALVVAGLAAWIGQHRGLAVILLAAAMVFRFQNAVWLVAVLALWGLARYDRFAIGPWAEIRSWTAPALLAALLVAFGLFVVANGGVAVGDTDSHPLGIWFGNLWLGAMLCGWLFLPLAASLRTRLFRQLRNPAVAAAVLSMMLAFVLGFVADHLYNTYSPDFFLRNGLIAWLQSSVLHRCIVAPLVGMAVLLVTLLFRDGDGRQRWDGVLLAATASAATLPSMLVEQRYLIPLFVVLNCVRRPLTRTAELALLAWWSVHSIPLMLFIAQGRVFP